MGYIFKKALIINQIINVVAYYPLKYLLDIFLTKFLMQKLNYSDELNLSSYGIEKLNDYLLLNFFVLLMNTGNNLLCDVLMTFEAKTVLNLNSGLKFVINIFCLKLFSKQNDEYLFVNGICYSNLISEGVSIIFVFLTQKNKNPNPQAWAQFNLQIFTGQNFKSILSNFDIFDFLSSTILFL